MARLLSSHPRLLPSFLPSSLLLRMSEHFMKQFIEQKLLSSVCYMCITLKRNQELFADSEP